MIPRHSLLLWLERGLFGAGIVLAAYCAVVLLEARYTRRLPIEPLKITQTLPGDSGSAASRTPRAAPRRGAVLARFEVRSLQMSTPVLEGSDDSTLDRGAGHIENTPFPGQSGNIGIAGHRDTVFRPLRRIKIGDTMTLTTSDRTFTYRVTKTSIVMPEDVYVLDPTPTPTVTLVTCYPFEFIGHAPKRFIVQGELVEQTVRAERAGGAEPAGR